MANSWSRLDSLPELRPNMVTIKSFQHRESPFFLIVETLLFIFYQDSSAGASRKYYINLAVAFSVLQSCGVDVIFLKQIKI